MLRNYFLVLWRTLLRQPFYFSINITGLAIGLAACLLIYTYVSHELSYDRFHPNLERIYRVNYDVLMGENRVVSPSVPAFVAPHLKRLFPEIEISTRFTRAYNPVSIGVGENLYEETAVAWADPNFFDVFNFPLEKGSAASFGKPNTMIVSREMARKYFGDEDPIGKSFTLYGRELYEVVAVMAPVPTNSFLQFEFLGSFASLELNEETIAWNNPNYDTYLLLNQGTVANDLQIKINDWVIPPDQRKSEGNQLSLPLEPMSNIHFNTTVFNFQGMNPVTDLRYVYTFASIAVLLVLIAAVNYINLSTARSIQRAKEVGIRKATGAGRGQLTIQFLGESFIQVLIALLLALAITLLAQPTLGQLLGVKLGSTLFTFKMLVVGVAGWIVLSLVAGVYPALVLSQFRPVAVLKGTFSSSGGTGLRKTLVVAQFVASSVLVMGTVVVYSQLSYMQEKKLGLSKEQVVFIRGNRDLSPKLGTFLTQVRAIPGVTSVAGCWRSPFQTVVGNGLDLTPTNPNDDWVIVGGIAGDEYYIPTMGMEMIAGRNLNPVTSDKSRSEFVVNEAFLRDFGLTREQAIGKEVVLGLISERGPGTIVGIVTDFHFASLQEAVKPVVIFNDPGYLSGALVKFSGSKTAELLSALEHEWRGFVPSRPFNFTFLDQQYANLYRTEERLSNLTAIFALIAISVGCLGLLGLAAFSSSQRSKEITIRKVLGATSLSVLRLLTGNYLKLILVAFVCAIPLNYWLLNQWLSGFAYRIEIGWEHYGLSLLLLALVAYATVSYQSLKAATADPVKGLRNE